MNRATTANIRLLGISGSIRRHSANTAVLEALRQRLASNGSATMTLFGLEQIPLFSADLEGEHLPPPVRALQEAIRSSDGLVLCSPEYNYGMSGVLKNAIDWASRPSLNSPLRNKPTLIMTAAPAATGGVRACHQIRDALASCLARVLVPPDVVIPRVREKIIGGTFVDEATLAFATEAIGRLLAEIQLVQRSLRRQKS